MVATRDAPHDGGIANHVDALAHGLAQASEVGRGRPQRMADRDRADGGQCESRALHRDGAARADRRDQLATERRAADHPGRPDGGEQALGAPELRRPDDLRDRAEGGSVGERARDADGERDGQHEPFRCRAPDRPERHREGADRLRRVRHDDHAPAAATVAGHACEEAEEDVRDEPEDGHQAGRRGVAAGVEHEPRAAPPVRRLRRASRTAVRRAAGARHCSRSSPWFALTQRARAGRAAGRGRSRALRSRPRRSVRSPPRPGG